MALVTTNSGSPPFDAPAPFFHPPHAMTITDATPTGERLHSFTLDHLAERMTVRAILRARIWQEVQDHNQQQGEVFRGLVQPTRAERVLHGAKVGTLRTSRNGRASRSARR